MSSVLRPAVASLLALVLAGLAGCDRRASVAATCHLPSGATVLAIGDSITRGHGADGDGYPEQLQALLAAPGGRSGVSVVNLGVDGERSDGLLGRLDAALDEHRPAVVVITSGGNDLLRRVSPAQVRSNLEAAARRVRDRGAFVALFAVPKPSLAAAVGLLSEHPLYAELADEAGVQVIDSVVTEVLSNETLKADAIHPNKAGYALMARAAFDLLSRCR